MRTLITGASGFLGTKTHRFFSDNSDEIHGIYFSNYQEGLLNIDITSFEKVKYLFQELRPEIVIHSAALSKPSICENDKEQAYNINVEGVKNVLEGCKRSSSKIIFISTSSIFDGQKGNYLETDEPNPLNYYGKTKLKGEQLVQESGLDFVIARVSWLYGYNVRQNQNNFTQTVLKKLSSKEDMNVRTYEYGCPTLIDDVPLAIQKLIINKKSGLYHITGPERVNRKEWSKKIAKIFELDTSFLKEQFLDENDIQFPRDRSLNTNKIKRITQLSPLEQGLNMMKLQMLSS